MPSVTEILLSPGDILYRAGDPNDCGYIIESGEVVLYSNHIGERIDCERRGAGSIVGELSILTGRPRTVTVEAVTDCRIFKISAEQILNRFDKLDPVLRACIETSISFSARFSSYSSKGSTDVPFAQSTLRNADVLIKQFKFENDLLKGLDKGEFSLVYQPIVRLSDNGMAGFESLMRWRHPTRGQVAPDRFIEVAETMGSIGRITEFALTESCAALRRIRASHPSQSDLYASVNISGQDIDRPGFLDFLAHVLDLNDLDPCHLKLEVTETSLVPDSASTDANLKRLRAMGCGISIDDFGTGYSNLAYLKTLPLTALKIDRAFAGDAHANSVSRGIVRMLVALGKELGVDIIAEGLETPEDVKTLRGLGCRFAQGYHFLKPAPEAELVELISKGFGEHRKVA